MVRTPRPATLPRAVLHLACPIQLLSNEIADQLHSHTNTQLHVTGSDYTRREGNQHVWFESVAEDDATPGVATGYWLSDALKGPDNPACLDGSAPLYYHRPGSGSGANKWYIHHEGGGWCYNEGACEGRAKTALGSTNPKVSKDGPTANLGGGYFDPTQAVNPQMYNWNAGAQIYPPCPRAHTGAHHRHGALDDLAGPIILAD